MAEKWTKMSSPLWRWMKPNPLPALNHFTVPSSFTEIFFQIIKLSDAFFVREAAFAVNRASFAIVTIGLPDLFQHRVAKAWSHHSILIYGYMGGCQQRVRVPCGRLPGQICVWHSNAREGN